MSRVAELQNTGDQIVGRAVCPVIGDWFEKVSSTITVIAVEPSGNVCLRYHGPLGESDYSVSGPDYDGLVRKTLEHGATFHAANR